MAETGEKSNWKHWHYNWWDMYPDIIFNSLSKFLSISGFPILSGHDRTEWPAVQMCNISNLNFLKRIYAYCIGICAHISIKRFWLHNYRPKQRERSWFHWFCLFEKAFDNNYFCGLQIKRYVELFYDLHYHLLQWTSPAVWQS